MRNEHDPEATYHWVKQAQERGLATPLSTLLDMVEPFAPVLAQALWIIQPMTRAVGGQTMVSDLARALDSPEELASLRQLLDSD